MAKRAKKTQTETKATAQRAGRSDGQPRQRSNATVMDTATQIVARTLSGVEDVGREVGVTAIAAVRGTMHTAEQLGGGLVTAARAAVEGTLDAAERIASAANRAVKHIVNAQNTPRRTTTATRRATSVGRRRKAAKASKTEEGTTA